MRRIAIDEERAKEIRKEYAKRRREANAAYKKDYIESYGKEAWDDEQRRKKEHAEYDRQERKAKRELNANLRREKKILTYMKKNDVLYYHHDRSDSSMKQIESALKSVKDGNYEEYDSYIWNRQGEGNSYMPLCQFHNIYRAVDGFDTIYDVPLDGTYQFHIYDSGQRGLGSFNYITATKVEEEVAVPFVNPGGFPQITV
jgi:hypothetical protein